ncbi:TetR/AcrR family transcriptional regulator [Streptomyces albipurpureus]|uniref:TetR/AcrR family transcriptional regulator n=1 Tax=Streptomyces albipurpureus TaxID=2897419 RepID=A0ABT0UT88_9ACTN|nr:TetR/AcrR family transcriptional regulator [Streptomyces sp. CWNU-1]MCM2391680.1 TetR/AcrR family transcriptional regulator [Streptomyces sp. CWNU-1]
MNIHSVPRPSADLASRLLESALALFAERTYEGTQMPTVAQHARVGVGSIYRYFPSKEALGNAAFRHAKGGLLAELTRTTAEPADSTREEFAQIWQGFTRFAGSYPAAFAFLEHQQHDTFLDAESRALAAEIDAFSTGFIERGQQAGEIRDGDPLLLVALALGAFGGLLKTIRPQLITELSPEALAGAESAVWDLLHRKT